MGSAAPGGLDSGFGAAGMGRLKSGFGLGNDFGRHGGGCGWQGGGGWQQFSGAVTGFSLARYNGDSTLDLSFNGTGVVLTRFGTEDAVANAIGIQVDGKIVVAGFAGRSDRNFALARYHPNGAQGEH